jgi:hypothetical protein
MKHRGFRNNALKLYPWGLLIGSLAGCATPQNQTNQIATVCQAALVAEPFALAATVGNPDSRADVLKLADSIAPICADPEAQYSDVALAGLLAASVALAKYAK